MIFNGGRQRKRVLKNVQQREENEKLRNRIGSNLGTTNSEAESLDALELLKVAVNGPESPFNRTKLFALGREGSGKEEVLSALFNVKLETETTYETQPIILGKYDAATFADVQNHNRQRVTMEVWNYSWKAVYNYLQDLYMTECTLYVYFFNMKNILSEDVAVVDEEVNYLKNILHSKKLLAPNAPVLMVGTHDGSMSDEDKKDCNQIVFQEILQGNQFNVQPMTAGVHYGAISSNSDDDLETLKQKISDICQHTTYIQENVPRLIQDAEKLLKDSGNAYMKYSDVRRLFRKIDVRDDDVCEVLLKVLAERGIITFLHKYERLRKFVVIDPEWLIKACGVAIYFDGNHKQLDFDINDNNMVTAFNVFIFNRVLSRDFLCHVLQRMGYDEEVHGYIVDLMKSTCMVADYLFDNVESYLTPTFFDNLKGRTSPLRRDHINEEDYQGPYFVLDFSGNHDNKVVTDMGSSYSKFMPFSYFEKLVSLSIQLSASFGRGIQPKTKYKKARLSFGSEVDFMLSVIKEQDGRELKIKVSTLTNTTQEKANDLLERLYSMAQGIKKDFYPGVSDKSILALTLLVPSTGMKLASYEEIQTAKAKKTNVIPNFTVPGSVPTAEYDHWLRNGIPLQIGSNMRYTPRQVDGNFEVPVGKLHHCMLSYKESSALEVIERQLNDLRRIGYSCWLNKEYEGELTLDVYKEAVRNAMCFILVLSKDVFDSQLILEELREAINNNVPIIFLHHPDTDKLGYWSFSQYIATCPADLRQLFEEIESIPLQKRFYLQEAVTNQLVRKIQHIMAENVIH